jgi:TPR repeat protein
MKSKFVVIKELMHTYLSKTIPDYSAIRRLYEQNKQHILDSIKNGEDGESLVLTLLVTLYYNGQGGEENFPIARELLEIFYNKYPKKVSSEFLGILAQLSLIVEKKNVQLSKELYCILYKKKELSPIGAYNLAELYLEENDLKNARPILELLPKEQKFIKSLYRLSKMYMEGLGGPKDLIKGRKLFEDLDQKGWLDGTARADLAIIRCLGRGGKQDSEGAVQLFHTVPLEEMLSFPLDVQYSLATVGLNNGKTNEIEILKKVVILFENASKKTVLSELGAQYNLIVTLLLLASVQTENRLATPYYTKLIELASDLISTRRYSGIYQAALHRYIALSAIQLAKYGLVITNILEGMKSDPDLFLDDVFMVSVFLSACLHSKERNNAIKAFTDFVEYKNKVSNGEDHQADTELKQAEEFLAPKKEEILSNKVSVDFSKEVPVEKRNREEKLKENLKWKIKTNSREARIKLIIAEEKEKREPNKMAFFKNYAEDIKLFKKTYEGFKIYKIKEKENLFCAVDPLSKEFLKMDQESYEILMESISSGETKNERLYYLEHSQSNYTWEARHSRLDERILGRVEKIGAINVIIFDKASNHKKMDLQLGMKKQ